MKTLDDVLVIGAGVMGIGIAQVAAEAGHRVFLFDAREGAAAQARDTLAAQLDQLVAKGRRSRAAADATLGLLTPVAQLRDAACAGLAIEAIVEKLEAKRGLLAELEGLLGDDAILASNTSSISITKIAAGLRRPERVVGMHFFNPVPLMRLVEVVRGLQTSDEVVRRVTEMAVAWGKTPVTALSTPGFIVNRIARPYYAEALMLLQERAAAPEALDACLRAAGFRMGPCELMDLIGHDTNFSVTTSVFEANFFDRRFTPSLVQRELVDGGLLGRKSGRGFYRYPEGAPAPTAAEMSAPDPAKPVTIHGSDPLAAQFLATLKARGCSVVHRPDSAWTGLEVGGARLVRTDGRTARELQRTAGAGDVAVFDEVLGPPGALAFATAGDPAWRQRAAGWLHLLGFQPIAVEDAPGLVVARTLAMLVNEAADAVQQGVCSPAGADAAMRLGVNYPQGPFEWLDRMGAARVVALVESLDNHYRGERYRVSPGLRRQA
ncbi:3-hydroxyacyl-CoA dehydrogenase [Roseateles saccharophilus]|uniref:3-hydroxyacyl-CoA dehydrogenase n=1 Tax=Roseateles saccharophilus TaxID=304 RepID=A0A4R3UWE6_ROSSA|nr:3-hydroxyacyl-CoA dehydrogenase [Roseateles saccharophilus]MDG0832734.1 3-hydroxyacyl-CoA dehydrogenase [Roseateles saccharophilus]TCU95330.1 3-hydroxyacyl-CoA dehydrogenase [Roseateles saccharophilus]